MSTLLKLYHSSDSVFGNKLTTQELKPVFDAALSKGLNLWDTAYVYGMGASEKILGEFFKEQDRSSFFISTKFTPQIEDGTDNAMQNMIDGSKNRLHTDYIDIYWIHNPMDIEKWTSKLIPIAKSKQINQIGVSNHNLSELKRANEILSEAGLRVSAVQNHYSLLNRSSEKSGLLDYCKENDITFFSYMVLEQGVLSGKYNINNPLPEPSQRGEIYNPILPQLTELLYEMERIAQTHYANVAQIAIAWAISKGTLPIIGVTKTYQVEDAAKAADIILTDSEIKSLEEIASNVQISVVREWEKEMK